MFYYIHEIQKSSVRQTLRVTLSSIFDFDIIHGNHFYVSILVFLCLYKI